MSKYGLPLAVVAGLVLAAALGAVAGARWATRHGPATGQEDVAIAAAATHAGPGGDRRAGVPRFVTTGGDDPVAESTAPVPRSHHAHLPGSVARAMNAPAPAGPRSEAYAEGPPPSPAALARAREVRAALESAVAAHPGTRVRFADCSSGACVARVESTQAAVIDQLIADRQRLPPGFSVRAREHLTAFNGRLWEAEFVEEGARP